MLTYLEMKRIYTLYTLVIIEWNIPITEYGIKNT